MSLAFNCGQYEQGFDSRRLQNWELRNRHRRRPLNKAGFTQIISNDRGHLLPSMPRSARSPWGTYVGTWDLPKRLPGNKQTDPMARSADAHHRCSGAKAEADEVIYGRTKLRRAKAGQPMQAMPTHTHCQADAPHATDSCQQIPSVRSGAENPMVKGTPPQRRTPVNQCSPNVAQPPQQMTNPELTQCSQFTRMSPAHLDLAASHHSIAISPNHFSPLPPLPGSAARVNTPPQVVTPKPTTPLRACSGQRQVMSPVM